MLFHTPEGLQAFLSAYSQAWHHSQGHSCKIGLVPTMGALHAGHRSLIERARGEVDCLIVSIFVNPLQFGPQEDYERYPRTLSEDLSICQTAGVDGVFVPEVSTLYPCLTESKDASKDEATTRVYPPPTMTGYLCGRSRPGHFAGVATVVVKLLNIIQPTYAYFGRKDAQQLAILKHVVQDLHIPTTIVSCPIYREASGLALSSRNQYLSETERTDATILFQGLSHAQVRFNAGTREAARLIQTVRDQVATVPTVQVDYVELVDPDSLNPIEWIEQQGLLAIAAYVGSTRLIDNVLLDGRLPILAIDGPAGAGKSTVTRRCAKALNLLYLDTGAMYRALTWWVLQSKVDLNDEAAIADLLPSFHLELTPNAAGELEVYVNDECVTQAIRSPDVTASVSAIAAQGAVRKALVQQQQRFGERGGVAVEGRDIGTHVFPEAGLKIFLTASIEERARRRFLELEAQGEFEVSYEELVTQIADRDRKDSQRAIAPLRQAPDAVKILTDGLTVEQVCDQIIQRFRQIAGSHPLG